MSDIAFLRSPPFHGVADGVAAVTMEGVAADATSIGDDMLALIARERVGGAFWGEAVHGMKVVARQGIAVDPKFLDGVDVSRVAIVAGVGGGGATVPSDSDPWTLIGEARSVHARPDDELALIAGLLNVPVFDAAGALVDPALLRATLKERLASTAYRDCFTGKASDVERAIACLGDWRRHLDGNRRIAVATGMAFWKREAMARFLWDGRVSPPFRSARGALRRAARAGGAIAAWPSRIPADLPQVAAAMHVPIARVEDGFLRSRGLGAALHPPGSVVVDRTGIYYDATRPNDLETLLATQDFAPDLVERAGRLRARLCETGVTKYGQSAGEGIALPAGRRTVLAIGQVEDDLSVRLGGAGVAGNLAFLEQVRRSEPDAWIIYRPHPDVMAGYRRGHIPESVALTHVDSIDSGSPLMPMVQAVDEVHVLSSLTGFEALMRGCRVTVHGMPFYAGWGLTRDLAPKTGRRGRNLRVDELVAGALILYPRYLDPVTNMPCGPEIFVDRMAGGSTPPATLLVRLRGLQGKLRRFMTVCAERFHG